MTPLRRFEIHQPCSNVEASRMLLEFGEDGGVYAGGTELLLAMRHGALRYRHLVDVKVLPGFDSIQLQEGFIEIGAGATHRSIERSAIIREHIQVFSGLEARVANIRVRASGTIGGNLCFAEPHSDPATLLLAMDAVVTAASSSGTRELRVDELICGAYANSLEPGELLMSLRVPRMPLGQRAAYVKYQIHERPTLGLAVVMDTSDGGAMIHRTRVAIGCLCPFPRRSAAAEKLLSGPRSEVEAAIGNAAELLADDAELIDDHEGGADYKRHLLGVFLQRAMQQVFAKA
jgi:aerobic carbon-monoxide dehydrogenase medium subunit